MLSCDPFTGNSLWLSDMSDRLRAKKLDGEKLPAMSGGNQRRVSYSVKTAFKGAPLVLFSFLCFFSFFNGFAGQIAWESDGLHT
jgi:hypothetical protein